MGRKKGDCPKWTPAKRKAIREAYLELPRTDGTMHRKGRKRKGAGRVKSGAIQKLMAEHGISCENLLWRIVYDLQPWNKGRR